MITYIKINGFKSFQNFEMTFTPLTVIAGANASGKSNLFDALRILSRLAETDLKTAFNEQRGNPDELFTQYSEDAFSTEMEFVVDMFVYRKVRDNWGGEAQLNNTRLKYKLSIKRTKNEFGFQSLEISHESLEKIKPDDDKWAKELLPPTAKDLWRTQRAGGSKEPFIKTEPEGSKIAIKIRQDGRHGGKATPANAASQTVLGGVNSVDFPHVLAAKEEMISWKFLQLNPDDLREPTKQDVGMKDVITQSGKNLASALFRIKQRDPYTLKEISRKLNSFLPNFTDVEVYDDAANRQYIIRLKGEEGKQFTSRVLSEGTLRVLTLCVLEYDEKNRGLICFEEPENGIHPFKISSMAKLLKDLSTNYEEETPLRQIIVNTHSPVLVSKLIQWRSDKNVSIWFSQQNSLIKEELGIKYKIRVTRTIPVIQETDTWEQLSLFSSKTERRLTLTEVMKFLDSSDTDNAKQKLIETA